MATSSFSENFQAARKKKAELRSAQKAAADRSPSSSFSENFMAARGAAARKSGRLSDSGRQDEQRLAFYVDKFGTGLGVEYFRAQLSYEQALERHVDSLAAASA